MAVKDLIKMVSTVANAGAGATSLGGMSNTVRQGFTKVAQQAVGAAQGQGGAATIVAKLLGTQQHESRLQQMFEMGQKALAGKGKMAAEELTKFAAAERKSAAFLEMQAAAKAKSSMGIGDVLSIGAKGAVTGMVLGAVLKAALAVVDLAVRAVTLNFVKSNLRKNVTIAGSAKALGLGIGGIATAVAGVKAVNAFRGNAQMAKDFEKAHLDGLMHANAHAAETVAHAAPAAAPAHSAGPGYGQTNFTVQGMPPVATASAPKASQPQPNPQQQAKFNITTPQAGYTTASPAMANVPKAGISADIAETIEARNAAQPPAMAPSGETADIAQTRAAARQKLVDQHVAAHDAATRSPGANAMADMANMLTGIKNTAAISGGATVAVDNQLTSGLKKAEETKQATR